MPRRPRVCPAGVCFHVLNRAVARLPLFEKPEDYEAFERVMAEAFERGSRRFEWTHRRADGELLRLGTGSFPLGLRDELQRVKVREAGAFGPA